MKVDRDKAHGTNVGSVCTSWSAQELVDLVCDVLESQSHLWERGDDADALLHGPALFAANHRIDELERELEVATRHRTELADAKSELAKMERKAAEDAALIKSLQEQLAAANAKLERLRGVLETRFTESIVDYGLRVREQAAKLLGGNHG